MSVYRFGSAFIACIYQSMLEVSAVSIDVSIYIRNIRRSQWIEVLINIKVYIANSDPYLAENTMTKKEGDKNHTIWISVYFIYLLLLFLSNFISSFICADLFSDILTLKLLSLY